MNHNFDQMSAEGIRHQMQSKFGWNSHDKMTDMGWGQNSFGYSIWFERWNWHGRRCDRISFGKHIGQPNLQEIREAVKAAAELALLAWESYPNSIPMVDVHGKLQLDLFRTQLVFGSEIKEAK